MHFTNKDSVVARHSVIAKLGLVQQISLHRVHVNRALESAWHAVCHSRNHEIIDTNRITCSPREKINISDPSRPLIVDRAEEPPGAIAI